MGQDDGNQQPMDAGAAPDRPAEPETVSVQILKALAHPVRQRLERALSRRGHARAADLAEDLGLPANQVSFHLRVFADAGLIEEAPEFARDRRDRVWKPTKRTLQVGSPTNPVPDERLGGILMQTMAAEVQDILQRVLAHGAEYTSGRTSEIHAALNSYRLWLTEDEWVGMFGEIAAVIDGYEDRHQAGEPGVRGWELRILGADDAI